MYSLKHQDQGIIELSQQDYLAIQIESFLMDRRAQGLSSGTVSFYKKKPCSHWNRNYDWLASSLVSQPFAL
jgi:hypothetical protein